MPKRFEVSVKSSIMDRERHLVIDPAFLEFDDRDLVDAVSSRFEKENIIEMRYGVRAIRGYMFTIGRIFCVDIRDESGKIISIRMKSIYGVRIRKLSNKYSEIIEALFENYFEDLAWHYLNMFSNNLPFELLGIGFREQGLVLNSGDYIISWEDLGTRDYLTYYAFYSKSNPQRYRTFEYLEDWNTGILCAVSRKILKEKNVWKQ
jgi:hypothetical protein